MLKYKLASKEKTVELSYLLKGMNLVKGGVNLNCNPVKIAD